MNNKKIESIIAKAGLTEKEKNVARVYYGSKSAGQKTKRWVNCLSSQKYEQFLAKVKEKMQPFLKKRGG